MRHPGHPSRQASMVPVVPIDHRLGRPVPPEGFSDRERALWEKLALSRRPNWFSGSERVLADYVTAAIACEDLQAQLRRARPGTSERYQKLLRLHRQTAQFAAVLATKLRLVPLSKTDKHLPQDGDRPLPNMGYYAPQPTPTSDDDLRDQNGERDFSKLRERMLRDGRYRPPAETVPEPARSDGDDHGDDDEPR